MKKIFALMLAPVLLLLILVSAGNDEAASTSTESTPVHFTSARADNVGSYGHKASSEKRNADVKATTPSARKVADLSWINASGSTPTDSVVAYALTLMGTPYKYGGTSNSGFDCSGFTSHVYQEFDVPVTRSSTTQSEDGVSVARDEARPGDLVIFTGTNPQVREPGHVGIVISEPGDTISFVHSSSNGGVKISQVEGTGYDVRFLDVRRVL